MVFHGIANQRFRLEIIGYYPTRRKANGSYKQRLLLLMDLSSREGGWAALNASVTTVDIQNLIDWFNRIANRKTKVEQRSQLQFEKKALRFSCALSSSAAEGGLFVMSFSNWLGHRRSRLHLVNGQVPKTDYMYGRWQADDLKNMAARLSKELAKYTASRGEATVKNGD